MKAKVFISVLFLTVASYSCASANSENTPRVFTESIDFISVGDSISTTVFKGHVDFMKKGRKEQIFKTCNDILVYNDKDIATYERFRFKLVTASCTAIYKYLHAKDFKQSFFPNKFSHNYITSLPAHIAPIINDHIFNKQKNKSLSQAYKILKIQERNKSTNILTKTDEFYINILARGDFDEDGFEDLIVSSQWYARNARGKYNDLVILSKTGENKPIEVTWRLHKANW